MARPRKPASEIRKRWDKLYVTDVERVEIAAAAEAAGLSVNQYLLARHRGERLYAARSDGALLQALSAVETRLEMIARDIGHRTGDLDAVFLHAALMAIERDLRHAVLPWALSVPMQHEGDASC